jgi:hypothetical protein
MTAYVNKQKKKNIFGKKYIIGKGFDSRQRQDFSLLHVFQTGCETHPASYPMSTGGNFLGLRRPVLETDHSTASSAESKNGGGISPVSSKPPGYNISARITQKT